MKTGDEDWEKITLFTCEKLFVDPLGLSFCMEVEHKTGCRGSRGGRVEEVGDTDNFPHAMVMLYSNERENIFIIFHHIGEVSSYGSPLRFCCCCCF
jgi:hypothetical protein